MNNLQAITAPVDPTPAPALRPVHRICGNRGLAMERLSNEQPKLAWLLTRAPRSFKPKSLSEISDSVTVPLAHRVSPPITA